ncbi:MAG TPA: TadE/TadG family type IV pilus assembly protein [Pseudolabrys sp.]|nr:TadE/TadG family type IV pilus assembly protein [Pseudolabrys sp.]
MLFSQFVKNCRGGVAPLLALSIVPLITGVGAAIDYTRASEVRTALQNSLDAAALMVSKEAPTTTAAQLQTDATTYVSGLLTRPDAKNVAVTATYSSENGSHVLLTGTATMDTTFMRILGYEQLDLKATSVASWGNTRLRVALVLDNTGSMASDGKMDALVTASKNLLAQLHSAAVNPEDVYVSIVPFSKDVNLDPANYQQPWINWSLWDAANGTCSDTSRHSQNSCLNHGKIWTPAAHSTWNGCVTDRDQNFDTTNDAPVAGGTLYPAEQYDSCSATVMGLSNDWTALSAKIDAMKPAGNTNQAIGLQVGWQSLTASPFSVPGTDPKYQYQQVIILLTDGLNTEDRWYSNASSIDTRESKTCANIKNAGITLYTVQVNTGGDPKSQLLEDCASSQGKFFLLTSADEIVTTFGQIGTALTNLHLAM